MSDSGINVTGGSDVAVLVGIALALMIIIVGAWVAVATYRGYRRSGEQSTFHLAVGIALASAGHMFLRVVLSTADAPLLFVNTIAIAVQFMGLVFVLYAIYGDPDRDIVWVLVGALTGGTLVFLTPVLLVESGTVSESVAMTLANSATAVLGTFISIQAYRGYHRYDRRPMLMLAVGIGLLTVGSFTMLNAPVPNLSDAVRIGFVLAIEFMGLLSIAVSLHID